MTPPRTVEITPHTAIGVSLALLGVVLTLDNLGFVEAGDGDPVLAADPDAGRHRLHRPGPRGPRVGDRDRRGSPSAPRSCCSNLGVFHFDLTDFLPLILGGRSA